MMVLALLLGAAQPCMPTHACPTRHEIERAFRRWVELSTADYVAEQSKSGDFVTVSASVHHLEHISCSVRHNNGRRATTPDPVECRFTTVNKTRRLTYVADFSHHGDLWEIDDARTVAASPR